MHRDFLPLICLLILFAAGCGGATSGENDQTTADDDAHDQDDDTTVEPTPSNAIDFPDDFLWGVSTSAFQTEGGNVNSDFTQWMLKVFHRDLCGEAADSYDLYETDANLAQDLGVNIYRIGIEWARIEPQKGKYDEAEIEHYRKVIEAVVGRGIKPMVTLHHFTNPQWVQDQGGWRNAETIASFVAYARLMAKSYGDLVDYWLTINEPIIYASGLCLMAGYPGGSINNFPCAAEVSTNMMFAHARAYHAIKEVDTTDADGDGESAIVSIAQAIVPGYPRRPDNAGDIESARMYDYFMNKMIFYTLTTGELDANGDGDTTDEGDGYYEELAGTLDFLGVNFYNSIKVLHVPLIFGPIAGIPCYPEANFICYPHGRPPYLHGDNGNPIEPEEFHKLLVDYADEFHLPIVIT
jgi:beta-glucosidase